MSTRKNYQKKVRTGKRWLASSEAARMMDINQKNLTATARNKDIRIASRVAGRGYAYNACDIRRSICK